MLESRQPVTKNFIEEVENRIGEGKVILAEEILRQLNTSFAQAFFYTDSYSDVPLLEKVAYPRVIAPDVRLNKYSQQRGWSILNWD